MKRIALYGGSFNPPHVGHVQVVSYVLSTAEVDEVWMMPCATHAFAKALAPFEDRLEMCRLALEDFRPDRALVSDVEGRLGGTSRTIDTVRHLMAQHPNTRFDIVCGTDIFQERESWKEFDTLEQLCRFVVVGRRGYRTPEGHDVAPPLLDVSSTEVRAELQAGGSISTRVPRRVAAYARQRGLYA